MGPRRAAYDIMVSADAAVEDKRAEALAVLRGLDPTDDVELLGKFEKLVEELWEGAGEEAWREVRGELSRVFTALRPSNAGSMSRVPFVDVVGSTGWFGKFIEYVEPAKSSPQLCFGAVFGMLAASMRRATCIAWPVIPLYPNVFVLLEGGTGAGKGAAIYRAKAVTKGVLDYNLLPNEGTHQGFAKHLQDRYRMTGRSSDGLIISGELRVLLSKDDKNKRDLVTWLTDWWDAPDFWERGLSGEAVELRNVAVSVIGASNKTWLKRMPEDAILGGFFPRWYVFNTPVDEERWGVATPKFNDALLQELQAGLGEMPVLPDEIYLDDTGEQWMQAWHEGALRRQYNSTGDDNLRAWLNRKQAALLKMAFIWQMVDSGPIDAIHVEWLERALRVLDWCDTAVYDVFRAAGVTSEGEPLMRVLEYIEARAGEENKWVEVREMKRSLRNRMKAAQVTSALRDLVDQGDVEVSRRASVGDIVRRVV